MTSRWAVWLFVAAFGACAGCAPEDDLQRDIDGEAEERVEDGSSPVRQADADVADADTSARPDDGGMNADARVRDAGNGASGDAASGSDGAAPIMQGVDPAGIVLSAVAANGTVGLDWSRVQGATGYRVYFSTTPGVSKSAQAIESRDPALVHRGVSNGTAYHYAVSAVLASGEGPLSPEVKATPAGEWVLEQLGSGDFDDVVTGARVMRVPLERRVQILLLPEGYLEAELASFHDHATHAAAGNEVDRWLQEVFAVEPYSRFKEAFVVWYLPRASAAHAGEGDTAFDVAVSNGGVNDASAVAAPLFSALDAQGSDAFPLTVTQTSNLVAAFLIYDPARRRAGFSGISTGVRNPSNNMQTIRVALGVGHAHEFTHAFAGVADEYMELNNDAPRAGTFSNVAPSNRCDDLPWAHLLEGRGINMTAGLVGAFGSAAQGYHSELYCMMNGTHENGQFWCAEGDERYTSLTLRPNMNRLCNMCREITAYRVFERSGLLVSSPGLDTWKRTHRPAFFQRFGFAVPQGAIPQTLTCSRNGPAKPVYEACVP
jgi:hypothetical protein